MDTSRVWARKYQAIPQCRADALCCGTLGGLCFREAHRMKELCAMAVR